MMAHFLTLRSCINSWVNIGVIYLTSGIICRYSLSQSSLDHHIPFILVILGTVVFLSQFQQLLAPDFQDDHLSWRLAHGMPPLKLGLNKLLYSVNHSIIPLLITFAGMLITSDTPSLNFIQILSFGLTLLSLVGWSLIVTLIQGKSSGLTSIFLLPMAIPSLLISQSLFSAVALGHEPGYYLLMQAGLALFAGAVSMMLTPVVIKSGSW